MSITVRKMSDDKLSCEVWRFYGNIDLMVLEFYGQQTRASTRHKWVGPFWDRSDERRYHSRLDRPEHIPDWVMQDALQQRAAQDVKFYIGFTNQECYFCTDSLNAMRRETA